VSPREPSVAAVGEVEVGAAGSAIGRDVDPLRGHARAFQGGRDRPRKIERLPAARVRFQEILRELAGHFGSDGKAAGVKAWPDHDPESIGRSARRGEPLDRVSRDPFPSPTPSRVEDRPSRGVFGDHRHRRAVRGRNRDPGVPRLDQESVGLAGSSFQSHDGPAVDLMQEPRGAIVHTERRPNEPAILENGAVYIADSEAQIEAGVRARARSTLSGGEPEPSAVRERAGRRAPEARPRRIRIRRFHRAHSARRAAIAQAVCVVLLLAGCARAPVQATGSEARARFLDSFGRDVTATRGAGMLSVKRGKQGRGGMNTRWAGLADSIVVVGYVGPVRALDATMLGDSVYVAIRPYDLGLSGAVPPGEGLGAPGLRFLARPWTFGAPWIRDAISRADVESAEKGWRLDGQVEGGDGPRPFILELNGRSEPLALRIQEPTGGRSVVTVRYGPVRRFEAGRIPRWIEWTHGGSKIRLDVEELAPTKSQRLRHSPPAEEDWTMLALDDPRGREFLRSLIGDPAEEGAP